MSSSAPIPSLTIHPAPQPNRLQLANKARLAPDDPATLPQQTLRFADILDVINPLQHIPVINYAYRALTGDSIATQNAVAGGALYGGPLGGLVALASNVFGELWNASSSTPTASKLAQFDATAPDTPSIKRA